MSQPTNMVLILLEKDREARAKKENETKDVKTAPSVEIKPLRRASAPAVLSNAEIASSKGLFSRTDSPEPNTNDDYVNAKNALDETEDEPDMCCTM